MAKNYNLCPKCKQDLRALFHDGFHNKFCSLCGQGLQWRREKVRQRREMEKTIRIVHALSEASSQRD